MSEEATADDPPDDDLADDLFGEPLQPPPPPTPATRRRRLLGHLFMALGALLGVFVILYVVDLLSSIGDVPRGVTVAGINVGGLSRADAEIKLRQELEPRLTRPFQLHAGDVQAQLVPSQAGLGLDWPETITRAGHQPLSPITRFMSFFSTREVGVATQSDPLRVEQAVRGLAGAKLDHLPTEGSIGFTPIAGSDGGVTAFPIEPRQGQQLTDVPAAVAAVTTQWLDPVGVRLPMSVSPVKASPAGVRAVLEKVVVPAVSGPVTAHGQGKDAVLRPADIAQSFQFAALDDGSVQVRVDQSKLQAVLQPALAPTETDGQDAQIVFTGDRPAVLPSQDARKIDWDATFKPFTTVMEHPGGRDLTVAYSAAKPSVTTDAANGLGITDVIGEFTTSGLAPADVTNNQVLAARVSGAIVKPGETFSLSARSGARTAADGYVSAPANEDGTGPNVVGGGVSQLASTLYNAAYLAGLADGGHAEHDYYLDRYPAGRDAKGVDGNGNPVELQIVDDSATGFAIQASVSGGSVTVRIWGTRHYRVEDQPGVRTAEIPPPVQVGPPAGVTVCQPSSGAPGFSVTDTRILYDAGTGAEVRRSSRTASYGPQPVVLCG